MAQSSKPPAKSAAARPGWTYAGSSLRHVIEFFVCLALAVSFIKTFAVEAYIVPTGSMAPTLLGLHVDLTCPSCGYSFAVGRNDDTPLSSGDARASARPAYADAHCPNCGRQGLDVTEHPVCAGDRLLVNRGAYETTSPARWEVVVFRNPNEPQVNYVKRVVGLPGEVIEIFGGDVYANGEIQRKTLEQQRAMRLLVYDNNYRPHDDEPNWRPRWVPERDETGWRAEGGGFIFVPEPGVGVGPAESSLATAQPGAAAGPGSRDELDWLVYRHWLHRAGARRPGEEYSVPLPDELRGLVLPEPLVALTLHADAALTSDQYELLRELAPPELADELQELYRRSQYTQPAVIPTHVTGVPPSGTIQQVGAFTASPAAEADWLAALESVPGVRIEVALSCPASLDEGLLQRLLALVQGEEARAAVERLYQMSHEAGIIDDCPYNGASPRATRAGEQPFNEVRDLFLECRLRLDERSGTFAVSLTDGTDTFEFRATPGRGELYRNRQLVQAGTGEIFPPGRDVLLEMSMIDSRVMIAVDGRLVFEPFDYEPPTLAMPGAEAATREAGDAMPARRVHIGAAGVRLEVRDLRLYRDIYYTDGRRSSYTVADDSYFVLGDNSPVSQDSRAWHGECSVPSRLLVGRPFLVHYPSRAVEISIGSSPRTLYVPNFTAIRYIR